MDAVALPTGRLSPFTAGLRAIGAESSDPSSESDAIAPPVIAAEGKRREFQHGLEQWMAYFVALIAPTAVKAPAVSPAVDKSVTLVEFVPNEEIERPDSIPTADAQAARRWGWATTIASGNIPTLATPSHAPMSATAAAVSPIHKAFAPTAVASPPTWPPPSPPLEPLAEAVQQPSTALATQIDALLDQEPASLAEVRRPHDVPQPLPFQLHAASLSAPQSQGSKPAAAQAVSASLQEEGWQPEFPARAERGATEAEPSDEQPPQPSSLPLEIASADSRPTAQSTATLPTLGSSAAYSVGQSNVSLAPRFDAYLGRTAAEMRGGPPAVSITEPLRIRQAVESGARVIHVQLDPPELGRVWIVVQERRDVLTARIVAANEGIRQVLDGQIEQLRAILHSAGVQVKGLEAIAPPAPHNVPIGELPRATTGESRPMSRRREAPASTPHAPRRTNKSVDVRV